MAKFKRTYCHDCRPHLIGVWDTVGSMGWFWGRKFFDSTLNHDVKYGYHAVSIDEQRKKFPANMWREDVKADHQTIEQVWFAGVHSDVGGWYRDAGLYHPRRCAHPQERAGAHGRLWREGHNSGLPSSGSPYHVPLFLPCMTRSPRRVSRARIRLACFG